ncbi:hypothetical protein VP1G_01651 [Cytospora mali]|uniref:Heterokaryon incompatibility domain-containing protein n=1 Tax=Cytospora mali TaxID=578113 RepID=A0A194URB5_CYTMA|nr:hypothetical protein VP1G_01651 [Valsa mali var. pyri (nom. inval.)]
MPSSSMTEESSSERSIVQPDISGRLSRWEWDFREARSELQNCVDNHDCDRSWTAELPTRLLDLQSTGADKVKLILTKQAFVNTVPTEHIRYAALSYCWGVGKTLTTTPSKLQEHMHAIRVSNLPLTLQQTIQATRDLGIRYLWIDALCILQREGGDSDAEALVDWQKESVRMHLVYGNATLTIVAAAASNSGQGLMCGGGTLHPVEYGQGIPLHSQPLSSRAWTLQEWLLSNRLLVFTTGGIYFICNKTRNRGQNGIYNVEFTTPNSDAGGLWGLLIENHCSRNITNPGDKLPAISGLAQRYAAISSFSERDYCAGLWRGTLLRDLLWVHYSGDTYGVKEADQMGRQPGRAPTWSWASIDGNTGYRYFNLAGSETAKIKDCKVKLAVDSDFLGQVKSGVLVVNCDYMIAVLGPPSTRQNIRQEEWPCTFYTKDESPQVLGGFWPDDASELESCDTTADLFCLQFVEEAGEEVEGIVVRFDEQEDAYVRVGYFLCDHDRFNLQSRGRLDFKVV